MTSKAGDTVLAELAAALPISGEEPEYLAALRAGSQTAFNWLVTRYQTSVYNLVYRLLEDPNDAADTVQEVFLKVFRGISGFKGECALKTWIYRIAVHEASNQRRWWSRHRRRELSLEAPLGTGEADDNTVGDTLMDDGGSPYDEAARAELHNAIQEALAQLPLAYRTVVVLRDVEDLSYEEIAEVLQMRAGTVKSRLARGREALRPLLQRYLRPRAEQTASESDVPSGVFELAGKRALI